MYGIETRKHVRYSLGSDVDFEVNKSYHFGNVVNSSFGGVLVDLETAAYNIEIGDKSSLCVLNIVSKDNCVFHSRVVRNSDEGLAFAFDDPLSSKQKKFLQSWFELVET